MARGIVSRKIRAGKDFLLPFGHQVSVFDFGSLKPDVMRGLSHGPLHHPKQASVRLAHLGGKKNTLETH